MGSPAIEGSAMDAHTLTLLLFPLGALALGLGTLWFARRAH
ncbi:MULTISPECIES: hypothetical protein [unclassified Methylobacterium]|jgi:hypothetical protein|nr:MULTISPECIES: hypothetical protein [unclassified Methylobacterium]